MNNFLLSMIICLDENSLDIEYYNRTLNEFAKSFGYHLQIDGSPFKYKYIEEILKTCKELGITDIGIRTDEKITEINVDMIKKYNIRSIMFRYDSINLNDNMILAKKLNCVTEISIILNSVNIKDIDNIIKWAEKEKVNLLVLERSIISKYRSKDIKALSKIQYKYIMEKILKYNHKSNSMGIALSHCPNKILLHKERTSNYEIGGCSAGIISCAIDINGNIIPCLPLYKIAVGNIKNDNILEVWNQSKVFNELRNRNNLKGKCGRCKYKQLCGGCRAEAFYQTGDLLEQDNTCWNNLK